MLDAGNFSERLTLQLKTEAGCFVPSKFPVVAAPLRDGQQRIVGVLGVTGPTRLNDARVVPMVDDTAQVISGLVRGPFG